MNWPTSTCPNFLRKRSAKLLLIFSALLLSSAGLVWACSFEDEDDFSSFAPEYFVNKHYSPFFYDSYNRYYAGTDSAQVVDNNLRYNKLVGDEWKAFLGTQLTPRQIDFLLFKANLKQADSVQRIVAKQLDGRGKTFFNYLPLMRDCETYAVNDFEGWYEKVPRKKVPVNLEKRITAAISSYQDKFIRERLWFQLVRYAYFQDATGKKVAPVFYQYEKEFPHNLVYYRALGYLAGAEYAHKDYAHANYHYSLCYNYTWQMYLPSQWSFHPQEEADWKQTLKLAKTPDEKVTLWHLLGIENDAGRAIREIVKLNPKSEKLDLLLSRVVNSYESGTTDYTEGTETTGNPTDNGNSKSLKHAAEDITLRLIDSITATKSTAKPYYWHLASGYLHYLYGDYQAARRIYLVAKKELPLNNKELAAQYKLLNIQLTLSTIKKIDVQTEARLLEPLTWLADLRDNKKQFNNLRFGYVVLQVTDVLGNMYLEQNDRIKANCFKRVPHIYADSTAIDSIQQLMVKANKTPFEKVMLRYYPVKMDELYYQQALLATYKENTKAAIAFMIKAGGGNMEALPANPFNSRLNDCHDCEFEAKGTSYTPYTPLRFLQTIKQLKDNLQTGKDKYTSALLLGGAYYNLTHYGNSRAFFQTQLSSYAIEPENYDEDFSEMFTSPDIAEKYYKLALQNAATNEQRAKCAFLLSKCERNAYYNEVKEGGIPPAGNWFKTLKAKYAATSYYKEVLKECGYFKRFVTGE